MIKSILSLLTLLIMLSCGTTVKENTNQSNIKEIPYRIKAFSKVQTGNATHGQVSSTLGPNAA